MTSSLLRGRLYIIIILSVSLLFLPFTAIITTLNNSASAQSQPDPAELQRRVNEIIRHAYEQQVKLYDRCVWAVNSANSRPVPPGASPPNLSVLDVCGAPPQPPQPREPLDCEKLNTCPTDQCEVVPTSLNSHDSRDRSRILFVDYMYVQDLPSGGHDACPNIPHLHEGKCDPGFALDTNNMCKPVPELAVELCAYEARRDGVLNIPRWISEFFALGGPFEWIVKKSCGYFDIPIAYQYCFRDRDKPLCITIGPGKP